MNAPRVERRQHKRYEMDRPVSVHVSQGDLIADGKTLNVSDGGVLLIVPAGEAPQHGRDVEVKFSLPRSTPNTYMLEEVVSSGRVVRRQPMNDDSATGVAVRFWEPIDLAVEV